MSFSIWLSKRLRLSGAKPGTNSTGVVIAVIGVALALAIMECTLASVVGFKHEITNRLLGFDGQVSILPAYDYDSGESAHFVDKDSGVLDVVAHILPEATPTLKLKQPGMLKTDNDFAGVYFIGYGEGYGFDFEKANITKGEMPDFANADHANSIVVSAKQSKSLGLDVGDKIYAYFFVNDAVKTRRFEIAGIYETGFSDYDKTAVFAPIGTLQKIANAESSEGTEISLSGLDVNDIENAAYQLQNAFVVKYQTSEMRDLYPVDNVKHTGAVFFNWLRLLDTNVVVIFILMSCVAGFTLISSMFIIILDRIPTIGLLRALGATKSQIRIAFINLAMKTVGLGLILGNILGIGVLLAQDKWHVLRLDPEMYYLPYAPVEINWWGFAILNVCVVLAAWFLLVIPSRMAANVSPAKTMRFE